MVYSRITDNVGIGQAALKIWRFANVGIFSIAVKARGPVNVEILLEIELIANLRLWEVFGDVCPYSNLCEVRRSTGFNFPCAKRYRCSQSKGKLLTSLFIIFTPHTVAVLQRLKLVTFL